MLDQADRARKMAEQELSDTNETLADLTVQNQSLTSAKRKLEQDLADLRHEADESHGEVILFPLSGIFGHYGHYGHFGHFGHLGHFGCLVALFNISWLI